MNVPRGTPGLPSRRELYIDGAWRAPTGATRIELVSPATGENLGSVQEASSDDVDAAVAAAKAAFPAWRDTPPTRRADILRRIAGLLRAHAQELALLDAINGGNPVAEMVGDVTNSANQMDYFAGLVTEMKGVTTPLGSDSVNLTLREPLGVVGRIVPFNHPIMCVAAKAAAPLAAGNTLVVKPPEQVPLSAFRFAELLHDVLPPGVFNVVTGGAEVGAHLSGHPDVAMIALIGSVPTGRAVMRAAAANLKRVFFELGGKNALIAYGDADPDEVARNMVVGMNFTWAGQSCGSTSRAFLHADIHDAVLARAAAHCAGYKPGLPTDPATTMGAIIDRRQFDRIMACIAGAARQGARLVCGGGPPRDPALKNGLFIEPTIFADVDMTMTIAREEVFGPVLSVFKWHDEAQMLRDVNALPYGLTCSIWTDDLTTAHRTAQRVEAGFIWINNVGKHFLGVPFGGYKQSGNGREESLHELLSFTQEKHIHVNLKR
jgi:betaine-aldehyde dehydrogenase